MGSELSSISDEIINISNEIEAISTEIYNAEQSVGSAITDLIIPESNNNLSLPGIQVSVPEPVVRRSTEVPVVPISDIPPEQGSTNPTDEPVVIKPSPDEISIPIENENGRRNLVPIDNPIFNNNSTTSNIPSSDTVGGTLIDNLLGIGLGLTPSILNLFQSTEPTNWRNYINTNNLMMSGLLALIPSYANSYISPELYGILLAGTVGSFFDNFLKKIHMDIITLNPLERYSSGQFGFESGLNIDPRLYDIDNVITENRIISTNKITQIIMSLPIIRSIFNINEMNYEISESGIGAILPQFLNIVQKLIFSGIPGIIPRIPVMINERGAEYVEIASYADRIKNIFSYSSGIFFGLISILTYIAYDTGTSINQIYTNRIPVLSTERTYSMQMINSGLVTILESAPKQLGITDEKLSKLLSQMLVEFAFLYKSNATQSQAINILFDDLIPQTFGTDLVSYLGVEFMNELSSAIKKPVTNQYLKDTFTFMINNKLVDSLDYLLSEVGLKSGLLKNYNFQPFKRNFTSILSDLTVKSSENPLDNLKVLGFCILPNKTEKLNNEIEINEIPENDKIFAFMSNEAYNPINERKNISPWINIPGLSTEESTVYENNLGEQILAIRGTSNKKDLASDIHIGKGSMKDSPRFNKELSLAKSLKGLVAVTGHSLGGSIANFISSSIGVPAITFNPGFITEEENLDYSKSTNYRIDNDPVSVSLKKGKNFVLKPKKGKFEHSMENFL